MSFGIIDAVTLVCAGWFIGLLVGVFFRILHGRR